MTEKKDERPRTPEGHFHKEAFFLMRYECTGEKRMAPVPGGKPGQYDWVHLKRPCGHHEIIWNSRDGVTPFTTGCPSCGGTLQHVYFGSDKYAPDHRLHPGQKFWRDMTLAEARSMAEKRIDAVSKAYPGETPKTPADREQKIARVAREMFEEHGGGRPWLDSQPW